MKYSKGLSPLVLLFMAPFFIFGCAKLPNENQDTVRALPPILSDAPGTYASVMAISMSSSEAGAVIHYTVDGTAPTDLSPIYTTPIEVMATSTLFAISIVPEKLASESVGGEFIIDETKVAPLQINYTSGTYADPIAVTMATLTEDALIRYTINGAEPTESSTLYSGPVSIASSLTLKARGFKSGLDPSETAERQFEIEGSTGSFVKKDIEIVRVTVDFPGQVDGKDRVRFQDGKLNVIHELWQAPTNPVVDVCRVQGSNCVSVLTAHPWVLGPWGDEEGSGLSCRFGDDSAPLLESCVSQTLDLTELAGLSDLVAGELSNVANLSVQISPSNTSTACGTDALRPPSGTPPYVCLPGHNDVKIYDTPGGDNRYKFTVEYWFTKETEVTTPVSEMTVVRGKIDPFEIEVRGKDELRVEDSDLVLFHDEGTDPVTPALVSVFRWNGASWVSAFSPTVREWTLTPWTTVSGGKLSSAFDTRLTELVPGEFARIANFHVIQRRTVRVRDDEGQYQTFTGVVSAHPESNTVTFDDLLVPESGTVVNRTYKVSFEYWYTKLAE